MMVVVVVVVVVVGVKPMQCTSGKGGARELKISEARVPGVVGGKGFFRSVADRPRTCRARGGETSNNPLAAAVLLPPSQISTPVRRRVSSRSKGSGSFLFFGQVQAGHGRISRGRGVTEMGGREEREVVCMSVCVYMCDGQRDEQGASGGWRRRNQGVVCRVRICFPSG